MGKLFEIVKESNRILSGDISEDEGLVLSFVKNTLIEFDSFLGLISQEEKDRGQDSEDLKQVLNLLLEIRNELRNKKMWELSDKIRDKLNEMGFLIEDKPSDSSIKKL
jgi:cysteinyl-tRNA synthetase